MPYTFAPAFPTPQHEHSAKSITRFFCGKPGVSAVLLTCSCARGRATKDSCLDISVLLQPGLPDELRASLEAEWHTFYAAEPVFAEQLTAGAFSQVDLDLHPARFEPGDFVHGWTSGADNFELELGNLLAYSHVLWEGDKTYRELRAQWLPYYSEELRRERLKMVLRYCRNNLAHIPLFVERELYFQAFKRLYMAIGEFLQALFISRRTYPIAYDKWIKEQMVEILGLPALYPRLVSLLEIRQLESSELSVKAGELERLIGVLIE